MKSKKIHLLGLDFESWILSENIQNKNLNNRQLKDLDSGYTVESLEYILKKLKRNNQKITFYLIMKLEELYPGLIERILKDGHEIGWHGYSHRPLVNESILKSELEKSKKYIQKYKIKGFQAPRIIFFKKGYSLLRKYGFIYSSSIYGNSNLWYEFDGIREFPVSVARKNYSPKVEDIEFPSSMSIKNVLRFGLPVGSSYFWSILGKNYYVNELKQATLKNERMNLFIHNWQIIKPTHYTSKYKPDEIASFLSNPIYYPYTKNVSALFDELIKEVKFNRFIDSI